MKKKTFDCVEMKNEAQARVAEQTSGMSREQRVRFLEARILDDPKFGPFWRELPRVPHAPFQRR